jgi:hypothetical protein
VSAAGELRDYLEALGRAATLPPEEALPLWETIVRQNPCNETYWSQLARARDRSGELPGAIEAYRKAMDMGAGYPAQWAYEVARCHALLGAREDALAWLARAFSMGFRDIPRARTEGDLATLRSEPRFRELVGMIDRDTMTRESGWRYDITFLAREVRRKSHHVLRKVRLDQFEADVMAVAERVGQLTDHQLYAELIRLVARLGDGHSEFVAPESDHAFRMALPLRFFIFEEGVYVIAAGHEYRDLVGRRVIRIGELDVDEIQRRLFDTVSRDNDHWIREVIPYRLREVPLLHALGLVPTPDGASLTLESAGSFSSRWVAADNRWPTQALLEERPCPRNWAFLPGMVDQDMPLYLRNAADNYWFERIPEHRCIYFQFNSVNDKDAIVERPDGLAAEPSPPQRDVEPLGDFTDRLMRAAESADIDRMIIDVRWNRGGNTFLVRRLLHAISCSQKLNREGHLFVVTGRSTFSAAQNFVTLLERFAQPIFVGEPTGSSPNFVGESTRFELPYSGAVVTVSDLYHQSSWAMDYRTWISPHVYVATTFADFAKNRDAALEAILTQPASRFRGISAIPPAGRWMPRGFAP